MSTAFDEHGNPYEVKPDSANAGGTDTGLASRDNIIEMFPDARETIDGKPAHPVPDEGYKQLGIGYGPVGGQQFPEACAMELMMGPQGELIEDRFSEAGYDAEPVVERGPQGEDLRFDPDQPRDPDGKFASTGAEKTPGDNQKQPEFLKPDMSTHDARTAIARNTARELNFPVEKVKCIEGAGREFKIGDRAFTEGGHAEIYTTGNIVIYTGSNSDSGIRGVVAHEVEHVRFEGVLDDYNKEMGHLSDWALNDHEQYDKVTDPVGFLDPEKGAGAVLPTATVLQPFLELNIDQLAKDDGVTDYSKAYWDAVKSPESVAKYGGYKQSRERAIHETLAEMAKMKFTGEPYATGEKPTKLWRDLFSNVNKLAKEKKYGY